MPWNECKPMDERLKFIGRLLEGEKMAPLCREFGISRVTGYKIYNRYKECGLDGLYDRIRATLMFFEADYAGAAKLYRDAIDREPEDDYLYRNLGDAIWHLDDKKAAEPIFRNAIRLAERQLEVNPDSHHSLETLVVAYGSIGDSVQFDIFKRRVLGLSETDPQMHYSIAVSASRIGDMETSRQHAEKACELGYPVALLWADPDIAASGATFD